MLQWHIELWQLRNKTKWVSSYCTGIHTSVIYACIPKYNQYTHPICFRQLNISCLIMQVDYSRDSVYHYSKVDTAIFFHLCNNMNNSFIERLNFYPAWIHLVEQNVQSLKSCNYSYYWMCRHSLFVYYCANGTTLSLHVNWCTELRLVLLTAMQWCTDLLQWVSVWTNPRWLSITIMMMVPNQA